MHTIFYLQGLHLVYLGLKDTIITIIYLPLILRAKYKTR